MLCANHLKQLFFKYYGFPRPIFDGGCEIDVAHTNADIQDIVHAFAKFEIGRRPEGDILYTCCRASDVAQVELKQFCACRNGLRGNEERFPYCCRDVAC